MMHCFYHMYPVWQAGASVRPEDWIFEKKGISW